MFRKEYVGATIGRPYIPTERFSVFCRNRETVTGCETSFSYTDTIKQQEVRTLIQSLWVPESRKIRVCVDSYEDGILRGRFYSPDGSAWNFRSLSRFLVLMEELLEQRNEPQSDTVRRSFSALLQPEDGELSRNPILRGHQATFELQILFRQHTSWQGILVWKEQHREQSFRSVLELILLMDSALRGLEGREAV